MIVSDASWARSRLVVVLLSLLLLLLLISGGGCEVEKVQDLKFVQLVYRHGDRAALVTFKTDPHGEAVWTDGFGSLTQKGAAQHYQLGRFLRERYSLFLNLSQPVREVFIYSSDTERTLQSAAANAAGMFPLANRPFSATDFLLNFWKPLPIHTAPVTEDFVLRPQDSCRKLKVLTEELYSKPLQGCNLTAYTTILEQLSNYTGEAPTHKLVTLVYDVFVAWKANGLPWPTWMSNATYEEMRRQNDLLWYTWAGRGGDDRERTRLVGSALIREIVDYMLDVVDNRTNDGEKESHKMHILSAHDYNLASLFSIMRVKQGENVPPVPPYASLVMFELFQNDTIRVLYKNDSSFTDIPRGAPFVLNVPGCGLSCHLKTFASSLSSKWMTAEEQERECADAGSRSGPSGQITEHRKIYGDAE